MGKLTEAEQNRLIIGNMGLVPVVAADFRGAKDIPFEELVAEGRVGLVKAARAWRTGIFVDYARQCMRNQILSFIKGWEEFIPLDPADEETEKDFYEWDVFLNGFPYENWTTLAASPEELMLAFEELCSGAARLASIKEAIKYLSRREREIITARFLGDPPQTIESIARDHKISYSTTVEILDNILKKLKKREEAKIIPFPARAGQRTKLNATAQNISRSARPSR